MKSKVETGLIPNLSLLDSIGRVRKKPTRYRLLEQIMDTEFEKMGVRPHVYHFTHDVEPFGAITIVDDCEVPVGGSKRARSSNRRAIDNVFEREYLWMQKCCPATRFIQGLKLSHIYGVAICDKRDQFNRQRGRIIAKGRLLKHLKEVGI